MRKNLSFSDEVEKRANAIMQERGLDGLSELFQTLVREEYDRRQLKGSVHQLREAPTAYGAKAQGGGSLTSRIAKKLRK